MRIWKEQKNMLGKEKKRNKLEVQKPQLQLDVKYLSGHQGYAVN